MKQGQKFGYGNSSSRVKSERAFLARIGSGLYLVNPTLPSVTVEGEAELLQHEVGGAVWRK